MAEGVRVPAYWTDDCQGKKDFDGKLVSLSTRYWPRGGGMSIYDSSTGKWEETTARSEPRPSATSSIYLGSTANDFYDDAVLLAEAKFEGETLEDVQQQVESWAAAEYVRIGQALRALYNLPWRQQ